MNKKISVLLIAILVSTNLFSNSTEGTKKDLKDKNGKKSTETIYKDGKENGKYFLYYSNGNIRTKGEYENGKPIGVWEYFDKDEKLTGKAETK